MTGLPRRLCVCSKIRLTRHGRSLDQQLKKLCKTAALPPAKKLRATCSKASGAKNTTHGGKRRPGWAAFFLFIIYLVLATLLSPAAGGRGCLRLTRRLPERIC